MTASTATRDASQSIVVGSAGSVPSVPTAELIEDELLVEEISIDGMCGVY